MGAPDLLQQLRGAGFTLVLTADGGIKVTPASTLDDADRLAIRTHRAELLALLAGAPTGEGLPALQTGEGSGADDRVTCAAGCGHFRFGQCGNHRKAGLAAPAVGRALSRLPQRCPGFTKETP